MLNRYSCFIDTDFAIIKLISFLTYGDPLSPRKLESVYIQFN